MTQNIQILKLSLSLFDRMMYIIRKYFTFITDVVARCPFDNAHAKEKNTGNYFGKDNLSCIAKY